MRAVVGLVAIVAGLSCGKDAPTLPAVARVDLVPNVEYETTVRAGQATELFVEVPSNRPLRLFAGGVDGTPSDSFVVIARAADGVTEIGRIAVGGNPGILRSRAIVLPAFPASQIVPLEVRGLRAEDRGRVRLLAEPPTSLPETAAPALIVGDTIFETFDGYLDQDIFTFSLVEGQEVIVKLAKLGGAVPTSTWLQLLSATSLTPLLELAHGSATSTLDEHTLVFTAPVTAQFRVRVIGPSFGEGVQAWALGGFRLLVQERDRVPESAPEALALGDTLTEALDFVGDVDRFSVEVVAGEPLELRARMDGAMDEPLVISLSGPPGSAGTVTPTIVTDWANAWRHEFTPLESGRLTVTVRGPTRGLASRATTRYQLVVGPPERAPESATAITAPGSTVTGESLEGCADVDEFAFTPSTGVWLAIGVTRGASPGCALILGIIDQSGSLLQVLGPITDEVTDVDAARLNRYPFGAGQTYRVRVWAEQSSVRSAPATPYTVELFAVDTLPEMGPASLSFDGGIVEESLVRCGDVDSFTLPTVPSGTRALLSAVVDRPTTCVVMLSVEDRMSSFAVMQFNPSSTTTDLDATTRWFDVRDWTERVVLRSSPVGRTADRGALVRLQLDTVSVAPEVASAALSPTDTVDETLSRCGDEDYFTLQGQAGDELEVVLALDRGLSCELRLLRVVQFGAVQTVLTLTPSAAADTARGFLTISETGPVPLRVVSSIVGATADRGAPYRLTLGPRNVLPENAPPVLSLGVEVAAEDIFGPDDVDVFTVVLDSTARYGFRWSGQATAVLHGPGFPIALTANAQPAADGRHYAWPIESVTSGTFRVRVAHSGSGSGAQPYTFTLYPIDSLPEDNPGLSIGTEITESLAPYGDYDVFHIPTVANRWYGLSLQTAPGSSGTVSGWMTGGPWLFVEPSVYPRVFPGYGATLRLELGGVLNQVNQPGAYRLRVLDVPIEPEVASATLAPGDSVTTEQLDALGDADRFTMTVTAGMRIRIALLQPTGCPLGSLRLSYGGGGSSGDFPSSDADVFDWVLESSESGPVTLVVYPTTSGCVTGPYRLITRALP